MHDDIGETKKLAAAMPEKANELHDKMIIWRSDIKAPMPASNNGIIKSTGKKPGRAGKKAVKNAAGEQP